jgi:hypothetical protein
VGLLLLLLLLLLLRLLLFCPVAEEPFELEGPSGVIAYLQGLLEQKGHAVICVSEGAGQNLLYPGACFLCDRFM